jgi:Collagen triple helix repeat (20 copies)
MDINKILEGSLDDIADNIFNETKNTADKAKAIQKQRIGENVQYVIAALKKIETDMRGEYSEVANKLYERIVSIKNGQDGRNGADGRAGKDGRAGRDGLAGSKGADGLPGRDGLDGVDGVSVTDANIDFDGSLIITLSNGRVINVGEVVSQDLADKIQVISTMSTNTAIAAITGGTIDGTVIGGTTPAAGTFTTLSATGNTTITSTEATLVLATTGQQTYQLISGGGGNLASGYFGIRNAGTAAIPFYIHPSAGANTVFISTTGLAITGALSTTGKANINGAAAFTGTQLNVSNGASARTGITLSDGNTASGMLFAGNSLPFVIATDTASVQVKIGASVGTDSGTVITTTSATGLAVTGTLSATGAISGTAATTFSLNNAGGGAIDNVQQNLFLQTPSGTSFIFRDGSPGYATRATLSSTGLAVTGTLSATGVATFAAGTFALPSITTSGDPNTGIYFPAADTIAFTEGGAEAMRIDSSGNVGIGAASPGNKLYVVGGNAGNLMIDNGGQQYTQIVLQRNATANTGGDILIDGTNALMSMRMLAVGALTFDTSATPGSATERMRINSSGNVGIGTASPSASAILDAQSTTKGVRMPNMTTTQKNAIATPAAGLMVYDTTLAKLCVYTTAWETITSI